MDNTSDADLVRAVLGGQVQAYATIVGRYERAARAAALTVVGDWHLAEDVAQEAFLRAYRRLASLKDASALGPWVVRIARNLARDAARGRRPTEPLDGESPAVAASAEPDLDDATQRVLAAVRQLPEGEWLAVVLRYFGGRSVEDIAAMTGEPQGTVTSRLHRARERLRSLLKELSHEFGS